MPAISRRSFDLTFHRHGSIEFGTLPQTIEVLETRRLSLPAALLDNLAESILPLMTDLR